MVGKLWNDTYHGNGKPGLTTRIKDVEDITERLDECKAEAADLTRLEGRVTTLEKYNDDRDNRLHKRMDLLIGAMFTLAVAVILQLVFKK